MPNQNKEPGMVETGKENVSAFGRRSFLTKITGATALTAFAVSSCTKSASDVTASGALEDKSTLLPSFPKNDYTVLNYAYALEQLEAAYYTKVCNNFYSGATTLEKNRLQQIRDHEIAHREFFKDALGSKAIPQLQFNFSSVDFSDRTSVITASKNFEDTGVSAYNGAGHYFQSADFLLIAGKIVSVEARHAAYLRDLLDPVSFADMTAVDSNGLDLSNNPETVLRTIAPYLVLPLKLADLTV